MFSEQEAPGPEVPERVEPSEAPAKKATKKAAKKATPGSSLAKDLGRLSLSDRGSQVRRVQVLLNGTGMFSVRSDGIYGPKTEQAVEEYQQQHRLKIDGVVGPKTWEHLLTAKGY